MSSDEDLRALADLAGILPSYHDFDGRERITGPGTQRAFLAASGFDADSGAAVRETLAAERARLSERWFPYETVIEAGQAVDLPFGLGAEWVLLNGGAPEAEGRAGDRISLPPVPPGVYTLRIAVAGRVEKVTILAAPRRLPRAGRQWGISAALYGLQSARSTGMGDFADLAEACRIAGGAGAGFFGINPVHAMGFHDATAISPYSPSHRGFLNTAYVAPDAIPGLEGSTHARSLLERHAGEFSRLRQSEEVLYGPRKQLHNALLKELFALFEAAAGAGERAALARFTGSEGGALERFAAFEAISRDHGTDWRSWPAGVDSGLQDPEAIRFHSWLQWVADVQLGAAQAAAEQAGMGLGLYLDLSVGPRRDGAESWCERDSVASGVSIGAPPDHLSPGGQNWNLAAYAPRKLSAAQYAPLRTVLSRTMRHAGVIRIDHVLGLNRSFWIPDDGSPGAYIRQNFDALLAVIKIEAHRAGCAVIGEDLGLVPEGFRETMRDHGFYGYSVLQYEKSEDGAFRNPADGPRQVLACFGTHDTPTVRGYETGRDIDWWHRLGWIDDGKARLSYGARDAETAALRALDPGEPAAAASFAGAVHGALAASPADLVCVQLDDILGQTEAQNLPGTIDEHPNWRRKYPLPLDLLGQFEGLASLSTVMHFHGRGYTSGETSDDS